MKNIIEEFEWAVGCVGPGWKSIVQTLLEHAQWNLELARKAVESAKKYPQYEERAATLSAWEEFNIVQVKEKFGGLRFYYDGGNEEFRGAVHFAEELSFKVCEECGAPGYTDTDSGYWMKTLCDTHHGARMRERMERERSREEA